MSLCKYSVDGSSLSINERQKLIQILDSVAYTGTIYVDMKRGIYHAFFEENTDISTIPFPSGTVLSRIHS